MTPMLILLFGVRPSSAISSDLGWTLCAGALAGGGSWLAGAQPWRNGRPAITPAEGAPAASRAGPHDREPT